MATANPIMVATRASAIPGATTARLAEPLTPIEAKECIMPQTVPKRPKNGLTFPVVARKTKLLSSRLISSWPTRSKVIRMTSHLSSSCRISLTAAGLMASLGCPSSPGLFSIRRTSSNSLKPSSNMGAKGVRLNLMQAT